MIDVTKFGYIHVFYKNDKLSQYCKLTYIIYKENSGLLEDQLTIILKS